jgi:hypothetical protein
LPPVACMLERIRFFARSRPPPRRHVCD